MFSEPEITYLNTQRLARIATVSADGQPDVAPIVFRFEYPDIYISGRSIEKTLKFKNIMAGKSLVAIVVDDLETVSPWKPRGIKIHGRAEIVALPGSGSVIKLTPITHWHWGIVGSSYAVQKVEWQTA
ncbi:MAG: PPOX class F420-dependent oxidoreductase [Armatimonadetes bacterium]|nr:PPOX class F420-dependent oxidoreductase [Anaerolineae bacterium]